MPASTATVPHLVLYTRRGCGLCSEGAQALAEAERHFEFVLRAVDVDVAGGEILRRFGPEVPVLEIDGEVALRHRIDLRSVRRCLAERSGVGLVGSLRRRWWPVRAWRA